MQRFDSRARLDAFVGALQAVIDRHDILRTAVVWEGLREPMQVVWRSAQLVVDETKLDPAAGDVLDQLSARFDPRHYRIDVQQAPLFRVAIARDVPSDRWSAVLMYHHLVSDHVALEVIFEEIEAHLLGRAAQLPRPMPFRNFVAQARLGISREEHEAFFRDMLSDVAEPTAPFGLIDVQGDGSGIAQARRLLAASLSKRIRAHTRALGVSPASLCHLGWAQVLGALSGRDDVVFGTVLFGRMQGDEGTGRALGLLINTLPIRIKLNATGVRDGVRMAHDALAQLMRHEHASLSLAQRCSGVAAPAPLFSALFNYRHIGAPDPTAEARRAWQGVEFLGADERTNYPLILSLDDFGEDLGLTVQVAAAHDPERICAYMQTALEQMVDALDRAPATPLRAITVLPESERRQVLVDWNATSAAYPSDRCIHELIEEQVTKSPDAVAVVCEGAQLTYRNLNVRANQLARHLRSVGVAPDTRVALCVQPGLGMVVALLAILKAGGAYVPLDPSHPLERSSYILEDSAAHVVLAHGQVTGRLRELLHGGDVTVLDVELNASRWTAEPSGNLDRGGLTPEHLASVIYTSVTSGLPKGLMMEHAAVANSLAFLQETAGVGPEDRALLLTALASDSATAGIFLPLISGARATLIAPPNSENELSIAELIALEDATVLQAPSSTWRTLLETGWSGKHDLKAICGGEPSSSDLAARLEERVHTLLSTYGPSDSTIWSSAHGSFVA